MNTTRLATVATLALLLLGTGGCETARNLLGDTPTAKIVGASLKDLDLNGVTLGFDVDVTNPYTVGLPVAALDLALASQGTKFLDANSADQGVVPANGRKTFPMTAKVPFAGLLDVLKSVKPGSIVPYTADLGVAVDAPVAGRMRLPVRHEGELPVPTVPDVSVKSIKWSELSLTKAAAVVSLDVTNLNQFPIDLTNLSYDLSLGQTKVATSSLQRAVSFGASGGKQTLDIPIAFKPTDFGVAMLGALTGSKAGYKVDGLLEGKTRFGDIHLPFTRAGDAPSSR